jgi:hypothetical protein
VVPVAVEGVEANGEVLRNLGTQRCPYCQKGMRTYLINDERKTIVSLCDHPHCGKISAALLEAARNGVRPGLQLHNRGSEGGSVQTVRVLKAEDVKRSGTYVELTEGESSLVEIVYSDGHWSICDYPHMSSTDDFVRDARNPCKYIRIDNL